MSIKKILFLVFAFVMIFALTACGITSPSCQKHIDENGDGICDNEGCGESMKSPGAPEEPSEPEEPKDDSEYLNERGELILYKNGIPTFQFVVGLGPSGDTTIKNLAATLSSLGLADVNTVKATDEDKIQAVEIIFGTVNNRGDEYKFDIHTLGLQGYVVKQVGTKILVIAGSDGVYEKAIQHLKAEVFGLKANNENITSLVMSADKNKEAIQDNYAVKDVTLDGVSIRGYSLAYTNGDSITRSIANELQASLYEKMGIWLPVVRADKLDNDTPYIKFISSENDGEGDGFYFTIDEDKNLTIDCEIRSKYKETATSLFNERLLSEDVKGTVKLTSLTIDLRNITYEMYGAAGDGVTDDFFAIKRAHDDANENKLIVHATAGRTYYIGNANGRESITVKTNTYWHGCGFIFDDEEIIAYGEGQTRTTPIFFVKSDSNSVTYYPEGDGVKYPTPITSLVRGQKNIGWAPGNTAMLIIYNDNVRHYIRYGKNENSGDPQHELIIVDKDGNVDPSTPIQWDYETITKIQYYNVDDTPIEIRGEGENGEYTKVETKYNNGPNAYLYYARNIKIQRSNVTLSGVEHFFTSYTRYEDGGKGSPYNGFTQVELCNNIVIENMIFECPETYYDMDYYEGRKDEPNGTNMGSYEISAGNANNITWRNCRQSNFFEPNGDKKFDGMMGTNFCKNLNFDNMFVCSFDAHCGVYNATIKNTICDHLNFIGDGTIILENVVIYAGGNGLTNTAANFRYDYGSTWSGDMYINGVTFKYPSSFVGSSTSVSTPLSLIKASFANHFFGYTCSYPQNITVKNIVAEEIKFSVSGVGNGTNNRTEEHVAYNTLPVYVFSRNISEDKRDLSHETFGSVYGEKNLNPTRPPVAINYYSNYTGEYAKLGITNKLTLVMPTSPTFNKTEKNVFTEDENSVTP